MRVAVDDVSLYFDVEGCGLAAEGDAMRSRPTLLLLHGGPGADHTLFKPEFSALTDVAQVIYLDQRGSGRSDHSTPASWTWTRWADDVAAFCSSLDIHTPVLFERRGGRVARDAAARYLGGDTSPSTTNAWVKHGLSLN